MPPVKRLLSLLVVCGATLAGCGADDDSETLSHTELSRKADAICAEANRATAGLNAKIRAYSQPDHIQFERAAAVTGQAAKDFQPYIDRLAALHPSASDERNYN